MKRHILIALLAVFSATLALAQPAAEERSERVQAFRVAVYTRVLDLSAEEAQGFWPIYNDFIEKREQLQDQYRPGKTVDAMSDAEVEDQLKRHFELKQRELDLERDTYQRLRKVLPLRKIARLPQAERRFREEIVQTIKENRAQRRRN